MLKLQTLNSQLCRKINLTINIFQLIYLPVKNNCLWKITSKKRLRILKCNVYFSCCSWYVQLTHDRPFTKKGSVAWIDTTYFQTRSIKKKEKHWKYILGVHNGKYSTKYIKKNMEITIWVWWCQNKLFYVIAVLVVIYTFLCF